eukprot:SAG22_NODE_147_length_17533_cov_46.384536_14_plen_248_part_00
MTTATAVTGRSFAELQMNSGGGSGGAVAGGGGGAISSSGSGDGASSSATTVTAASMSGSQSGVFSNSDEEPEDKMPVFTMEEVAKHDNKDSCWLVIRGKVYDTTTYNDMHPGGSESILMCAGDDGTEDFDAIAHSEGTLTKLLKKYYIGKLGAVASPGAAALASSAPTSASAPVDAAAATAADDLVGLVPKKWVKFKLAKSEVLSPDTVRLWFAMPSPQHRCVRLVIQMTRRLLHLPHVHRAWQRPP